MWFAASIIGALLLQSPQQTAIDPTVQLEVAVRTYRSDGVASSSASSTVSPTSSGHIWLDGTTCGMGAGTAGPEGAPRGAEVWTSAGRILQHTGDEYQVELDVRHVGGPAGSVGAPRTLTLHLGQPTIIEEVPASANRCNGRSIRIEATVVPAKERSVASGMGSGRSGAASGGFAGAGPRATTAGAAGGVSSGTGGATGARATGSGGAGSGTAGAVPQFDLNNYGALYLCKAFGPTFCQAGGPPTERSVLATDSGASTSASSTAISVELRPLSVSLLANMWLLYTTPDGVQHTQSQVGHVDDLGETFGFGLVPTRKADGTPAMVVVRVNLRPMSAPDGRPVLRAAIARIVNNQSVGVSNRAIPMPGKGDVVSFEIPATAGDQEWLAAYHFEVRVKIMPAGTP